MADQRAESGAAQDADRDENLTEHETLGAYARAHFRQTRGPWAFGVVAAILAAPALSLAKPKLGLPGMGVVLLGIAGAFVVFGGLFFLARMVGFLVAKKRTVSSADRSFVAPLAFSSLILLIAMVGVVVAECFAGDRGLLAQAAPALGKIQDDLKWTENTTEVADASDSDSSDDSDTDGSDGASQNGPDADANEASSASAATDQSAPDGSSKPKKLDPPPEESAVQGVDEQAPVVPNTQPDSGAGSGSNAASVPAFDGGDDLEVDETNKRDSKQVDAPPLDSPRDPNPTRRSNVIVPMVRDAMQLQTVVSREQLCERLEKYLEVATAPGKIEPGASEEDTNRRLREAFTATANQLQFLFPKEFCVYDLDAFVSEYDPSTGEFPRMRIQIGEDSWRAEGAIGVDLFLRENRGPESKVFSSPTYVALTNSSWPSESPLDPAPPARVWFAKGADGKQVSNEPAEQRRLLNDWLKQQVRSTAILCFDVPCPANAVAPITAQPLKAAVHFRFVPDDAPRRLAPKLGAATLSPQRFLLYVDRPEGPQIVFARKLPTLKSKSRPSTTVADSGSRSPERPAGRSPDSPPTLASDRTGGREAEAGKLTGDAAKLLESQPRKLSILEFRKFFAEDYVKQFTDANQAEFDTLDVRAAEGMKRHPYFPYSIAGAGGKLATESLTTFKQRVEIFEREKPRAEKRIATALDKFIGDYFADGPICVYGIPALGSGYDAERRILGNVEVYFAGIDRDSKATPELLPLSGAKDPRRAFTSPKPGVGAIQPILGGLRVTNVELDVADAERFNSEQARRNLRAAIVFDYVGFVQPRRDVDAATRIPLLTRKLTLYEVSSGRVIADLDMSEEKLHREFLRLPVLKNPYPGYEMREWSDEKDNQQTAKFIRRVRDTVVLRDEAGVDIELPLKNLSTKDRNFVRRLTAKKPD